MNEVLALRLEGGMNVLYYYMQGTHSIKNIMTQVKKYSTKHEHYFLEQEGNLTWLKHPWFSSMSRGPTSDKQVGGSIVGKVSWYPKFDQYGGMQNPEIISPSI